MSAWPMDPRSVHRLAKMLLDEGTATNVADAEARLRALSVQLHIDAREAKVAEHQATLLTAVALARRAFLGGVLVSGAMDARVVLPLGFGKTLGRVVRELGGNVGEALDVPLIYIGGGCRPLSARWAVRTVCAGWRGGVLPAHQPDIVTAGRGNTIAGVLAAGLAINEAFLSISDGAAVAGKRDVGLSLWKPESIGWTSGDGEPGLTLLPSRLWLIGLGHLGQAYLWTLGMLPYGAGGQLEVLLQDFDGITSSTWSTSMLTPPSDAPGTSSIGMRKTRLMADWAETRGFVTRICERKFDGHVARQDDEPSLALCGVDNASARRALDKAGFDFVVSTGLGSGHLDFRSIRLHTLPAERAAEDIWREVGDGATAERDVSAYEPMVASGAINRCGAAVLAGIAVGAPFVGVVAATLAIAEVLRLLHGARVNRLIDLDLMSLEHRVVLPQAQSLTHINPGFIQAA